MGDRQRSVRGEATTGTCISDHYVAQAQRPRCAHQCDAVRSVSSQSVLLAIQNLRGKFIAPMSRTSSQRTSGWHCDGQSMQRRKRSTGESILHVCALPCFTELCFVVPTLLLCKQYLPCFWSLCRGQRATFVLMSSIDSNFSLLLWIDFVLCPFHFRGVRNNMQKTSVLCKCSFL